MIYSALDVNFTFHQLQISLDDTEAQSDAVIVSRVRIFELFEGVKDPVETS
jgi:hypothetical protein